MVPALSVVIPVKDGAAFLPPLLAALAAQQVDGPLELVSPCSASRDRSRQILEASPLRPRLLDVAPGAFDHGATRNRGAREASGEFVVFLSQDALPLHADFLSRLVAPLRAEPRLAGAFARQRPREGADAVTRERLGQGVASGPTPRRVFASAAELDALAPLERLRLCTFDNVASAVRRDVLLAHPFPESRFGEDVEWADRVLRAGYGIAYEPGAEVCHSHPRRTRDLYRRHYLGHRALFRLFGLATIPSRAALVRACLGGVVHDLRVLAAAGDLAALAAAPLQAVAEKLGQYFAARDERCGRPYPRWA